MINRFSRTEMLLGNAVSSFKNRHVAVFGVGGVGGHLILSLVRCGIGKITVVDNDVVSITNINRQAVAFTSTIGQKKVDVIEKLAKDINPEIEIIKKDIFFSKETLGEFDFDSYDYVADAIDSVTSKLLLAQVCNEKNIPEISSMGTGNKTDPERFTISDISKTSVCPLAKVMRRELRKRGIKKLQVLWSDEEPIKPRPSEEVTGKRQTPGSIAFCPATAGLLISGKIIRDLAEKATEEPFLQSDGEETFI